MSKLVTAAEAVSRIGDGAVVTVSSSSALGCPDLVLKALGDRFRAEGHPRGITTLCLLYTSPSPRDRTRSRMPSSA